MRFALIVALCALAAPLACSSSDSSGSPVIASGDASVPPPPPSSGDDAGDDADSGQTPNGINISGGKSQFEAEDQIAVAPDGMLGVLYSTVGPNTEGMSYRFSSDDGKTWSTAGNIVLPQNDLYAGDPAITTDAEGNFYAALLGIHYDGTQNVDYIRIYAAKAPKGSTQFGEAVEVTDTAVTKFHDHPKIFVTKAGTIVIGYLESDSETSSTGSGIAATSTNGTDWTRQTLIAPPDTTFANLFSMCEGSGAIYATFFQIGNASYGIGIRKSVDQGATWSATTNVSLVTEHPAGLDPRCAANGSDVWVSYAQTDMPAASEEDLDAANSIVVAHSSDGAMTFPERGEALDTKATKLGCLPEFVRDDSGGLSVAYIAGDTDGDFMGSVRFTRATSGLTFGASTVVDSPVRFIMSRSALTWLGDYFGFAAHGKTLYFAYPQNQTGKTHIYFSKATLP
ncbi:MAG TPA: sialidase family protein [Labilithrix sp.]